MTCIWNSRCDKSDFSEAWIVSFVPNNHPKSKMHYFIMESQSTQGVSYQMSPMKYTIYKSIIVNQLPRYCTKALDPVFYLDGKK